ncbi:MAG: helix-turn-helix domain-containing protein [Thermodesulfobacteriota bacterium]
MRKLNSKVATDSGVFRIVEDIIGCKWSIQTLQLIKDGVNRPGAMVRSVDGLTTKVLNERLSKMVKHRILEKHSYPEIPPRVEYKFTDFGKGFLNLLDEIDKLQEFYESGFVRRKSSSSKESKK